MQQEKEKKCISLLKKSKRGILRMVFSRAGMIALLVLVEMALTFALLLYTAEAWPPIFGGTMALSLCMAFYLLNIRMDPTAKITWLIVFTLLPVFGALFFLYTRSDLGHRALRRRTARAAARGVRDLPKNSSAADAFAQAAPRAAALATYLEKSGYYPVYQGTEVTYFPSGEEKFAAMLQELEKAESFIFLEYFIIAEGEMWGQVLEVLARRAAAGVTVRVMYDGTCEFTSLSRDYPARLQKLGIACRAFAPIKPFISTHYNYRDHRKILVVDGRVAFTGGVNLADEYINRLPRFGHWKDTAIMLRGDAVASFTRMFLDMWDLDRKEEDIAPYLSPSLPVAGAGGFVLPYADCPLDQYKVGERVYIDMLSRAERCVKIMTPYLILDGEMENAILYAAERGVAVTLILPGIPDKKMPYVLARTYFPALLAAGVKLYEYTPGFLHAKVVAVDGKEAVVGTINLDYRSFYHHFECAAYLYDPPCMADIEADFAATLEKCSPITQDTVKKERLSVRLLGALAKAIAPLL